MKVNCNGCGKEITDEIDLWDKVKQLCDKCSIKQNSKSNNKIKPNLSYVREAISFSEHPENPNQTKGFLDIN